MAERGSTASADQTVKTSFHLRKSLHRRLKMIAAREDREMQEIVSEALEIHLAKIERTADR
ncbi:MAG TPA: hypothetical protein VHC20_06860 [Candidatus Paceibacterota bacterium]|nr:hypothetical protein [Candidatus Paceibacterota bacterium]